MTDSGSFWLNNSMVIVRKLNQLLGPLGLTFNSRVRMKVQYYSGFCNTGLIFH